MREREREGVGLEDVRSFPLIYVVSSTPFSSTITPGRNPTAHSLQKWACKPVHSETSLSLLKKMLCAASRPNIKELFISTRQPAPIQHHSSRPRTTYPNNVVACSIIKSALLLFPSDPWATEEMDIIEGRRRKKCPTTTFTRRQCTRGYWSRSLAVCISNVLKSRLNAPEWE